MSGTLEKTKGKPSVRALGNSSFVVALILNLILKISRYVEFASLLEIYTFLM